MAQASRRENPRRSVKGKSPSAAQVGVGVRLSCSCPSNRVSPCTVQLRLLLHRSHIRAPPPPPPIPRGHCRSRSGAEYRREESIWHILDMLKGYKVTQCSYYGNHEHGVDCSHLLYHQHPTKQPRKDPRNQSYRSLLTNNERLGEFDQKHGYSERELAPRFQYQEFNPW